MESHGEGGAGVQQNDSLAQRRLDGPGQRKWTSMAVSSRVNRRADTSFSCSQVDRRSILMRGLPLRESASALVEKTRICSPLMTR